MTNKFWFLPSNIQILEIQSPRHFYGLAFCESIRIPYYHMTKTNPNQSGKGQSKLSQ